jgi:hypothetical protein
MTDTFSISVEEWLGPGTGDSVEQATNAAISISVREYCATQVEDFASKTVRSTIRVSAEPIAKWLLANWWRLRCETEPVFANAPSDWSMSHSMAAIGHGYVWPDLIFRGSDGAQISVVCKRHHSAESEKFSTVRFLNSFNTTISVSDFEDSSRSFVEAVLARLADLGIRKSALHDLWNDLSAEWANPKYRAHRRLEALLGLEPDQNDALISSVMRWGKQFGPNAMEEIAAESNSREIAGILKEAKSLANKRKTFADIHAARDPTGVGGHLPPNRAPWQHAQSLAYELREQWGFDVSPISDQDLADRLGLGVTKLKETYPDAPFSFGIRGPADGKLGFLLNRSHDQGRRFDTARLIGDYIAFDRDEKIIPATNTMTMRQKFQRAFAAEFLCPSMMIKERYSDIDQRSIGRVIDEISTEYNVSEQVVRHHMENRQVLSHDLFESSLLLA